MRVGKYGLVSIWILFLGTFLEAGSLNEQIEEIQLASPVERVEMMNRLKLQIAAMNEAERAEALNTLQRRGGSNKMMQLRHNNSSDGTGGQYRYRLNAPTNGGNRQQGRQ